MRIEYVHALIVLVWLSGLGVGFVAGIWKAAKMQALREAQQAHLARVEDAIKRGTRIVNPVPMPRPGKAK